jgi:hypothetical protein
MPPSRITIRLMPALESLMSAVSLGRGEEKGTSTMLTPTPQRPDERGKHWLQAQVQQILAASAAVPAQSRSESDPSCYWGTGPETSTTLYILLAGDPEPKALPFSLTMIAQCGSGLYVAQHNAIMLIRRTLRKMGIVPA